MNCPRCQRVLEDGSVMCHGCGLSFGQTPELETETVTNGFAVTDGGVGERFAPLTGRQSFGGLLVHSALGEGAMGATYLASYRVLQMPLVIKLFKTSAQADIFGEAHLYREYTPPVARSPIEADIFAVIEQTLRKRPEERYQTAEALARVLHAVSAMSSAVCLQRCTLRVLLGTEARGGGVGHLPGSGDGRGRSADGPRRQAGPRSRADVRLLPAGARARDSRRALRRESPRALAHDPALNLNRRGRDCNSCGREFAPARRLPR